MPIPPPLAARFPKRIRERGAEYERSGMVELRQASASRVEAQVSGTDVYHVSVVRNSHGDFNLSCNCPYAEGDVHCKHVWATLLEADATVGLPLVPEGDTQSASAPPVLPPPAPPAPNDSWKAQLRGVRAAFDPTRPPAAPAAWPEGRRILYIVDATPISRGFDGVAIDVATQALTPDGTWGTPKQMRQSRAQWLAAPDAEDRLIAQMLVGARPEYSFAAPTAASRYTIPADALTTTLQRACLTGRCRVRSLPRDPDPPVLRWDAGDEYDLRLVVAPGGDGRFELHGMLVREAARIDVRDCTLITAGGIAIVADTVVRYRDHGAFPLVRALRTHLTVAVSREHALDLVGELLEMPVLPPLDLPDDLHVEHVHETPVPRLSLATARHSPWETAKVAALLSFDYGGRIVAPHQREQAIFHAASRQMVYRDLGAETAAAERLQAAGFRREYDARTGRQELRLRATKLDRVVHELVSEGWFVEHGGHAVRGAGAFAAHVTSGVTSGIDWFDLEATVDFGPVRARLPELLAALARGDRTIALADGSLGILGDDWTARAGLLASLGREHEGRIRFATSQVALLDALVEMLPRVSIDERFAAARSAMLAFEGVAPRDPPPGFTGTLRPYQRDGLGWLGFLADFGFGGCLADDMGLGKTVQALALLEDRRRQAAGPSLVVVPRSLIFNWRQEAARFTPEMKVLVHSGAERRIDGEHLRAHDLVLITYGTLRRDAPALAPIEFDYVILDEAQTIKNPATASAKAARLLRARHRLAMTGTPIENRPGDLWSILEFLNPGMLGGARVFQRIMKGVPDEESLGGDGAEAGMSRTLIVRAVRPFLLRRTKEQVAPDLPERLEQTIYVDLSEKERKLYDELRDHYRQSLLSRIKRDGMAKSSVHVLEALLRLRQAASHAGLIDKSRAKEPSSKLDLLLASVSEAVDEGHKVLVFSQFTTLLAIVRRQLEEEQLVYEYLDGQTRDREQRVTRFQTDPECRIFLISLKAGGLGLNLTAADYVFLLDPWWNPAVEAQAIDRAHRIGQTRRVFASRLIARDTVEEKVLALQERKRDLADAIIRADDGPLASLKREDLELLLGD